MKHVSLWLVVGCLVTSFLGGAAASVVFRGVAFAQRRTSDEKVLRAHRFEIINDRGIRIGWFGTDSDVGDATLSLIGNRSGNTLHTATLDIDTLSFAANEARSAAATISYDEKSAMFGLKFLQRGKVIWSQP